MFKEAIHGMNKKKGKGGWVALKIDALVFEGVFWNLSTIRVDFISFCLSSLSMYFISHGDSFQAEKQIGARPLPVPLRALS